MEFTPILSTSLWSALFALSLGILLTAPRQYLFATFVSAFVGRFARDGLTGWGMDPNWATVAATILLVFGAVSVTRNRKISPVVLICGVLPLGAATAVFSVIFELMKLSKLKGDDLAAASVAFNANLGKAVIGTLAIALGLGVGMAAVQLFKREEAEGV